MLCSEQHALPCVHPPLHTRPTPCTHYHRGISELGLSKLDAKARRDAVAAGLKAFSTFSFYPEQVDALLYYVKSEVSCWLAGCEVFDQGPTVTAAGVLSVLRCPADDGTSADEQLRCILVTFSIVPVHVVLLIQPGARSQTSSKTSACFNAVC